MALLLGAEGKPQGLGVPEGVKCWKYYRNDPDKGLGSSSLAVTVLSLPRPRFGDAHRSTRTMRALLDTELY